VAFQRDRGRIFYFSPGHETFPVYHDGNVLQVISNAIRWAAPDGWVPDRITKQPEPLEKVVTENPLAGIDTSSIH